MIKKITLNLIGKLCMLAVIMMSGSFSASADEDLGSLELNTVYSCPSFKYVRASFTPEATGTYRINYSGSDRFAIYSDADLTIAAETGTNDWVYKSETVEGLDIMGYEVRNFEAGVTYYFGGQVGTGLFIMNSNACFVITAASSAVVLDSTVPVENSTVSVGTTEKVDFVFNMSVNVESATISSGSVSETFSYSTDADCKVRVYANCVSVLFKEILLDWLTEGKIAGDDEFTVTLNGVTSSDGSSTFGEDGKVSVKFIAAPLPAQLVSTTNTPDQMDTLYSYYLEGDEKGTITLTFDQDLLVAEDDYPVAVWGAGNKESEDGDYYEETIPCKVEGKTLIVNLQNKLRNQAAMELSMEYTYVQLDVKNIKSADGNYVYSEGSGKLGSFNYMYDLEYLNYDIASDFTPASGTIKTGDEIEIWIRGEQYLQYDGVTFKFTENGEDKEIEVGMDSITRTDDSSEAGAAILTLVVPEFVADTDSKVEVYLTNMLCADGVDHSADVKATYSHEKTIETGEFTISPSESEYLTSLKVFYLTYEGKAEIAAPKSFSLYDADKNEVADTESIYKTTSEDGMTTFYVELGSEITTPGTYTLEIPEGYFLLEDEVESEALVFTYTVEEAVEVGELTIEPAEDAELTSLKTFYLTYSGEKMDFGETAVKITLYDENHNVVSTVERAIGIVENEEDLMDFGFVARIYELVLDNEITAAGTYTLEIPAGYFLYECKVPNEAVAFTFTIKDVSVESINVVEEYDVYSIDGKLLKSDADAEYLKTLDEGIYIVNGKKIYLHK